MKTADIIVLTAYLAIVLGIGFYFARRSKTSEGFMKAGGRLPGWVIGLSLFGTYLSSNTFIGVPGKAYAGNWNAFVFSLSIPIAILIATKWFVKFYRDTGEISAYEHLEKRFGVWARVYAVICYLLTQIARTATIMLGVAIGLQQITGWDLTSIILISGILVTAYTLIGGIEAVIWTDAIQSIVLTLGAILVIGTILAKHPAGASSAFCDRHRQRKILTRQLEYNRPSQLHYLDCFSIRTFHQPDKFRHRSKLHPALPYRAKRRRRKPFAVDWRDALPPSFTLILPDWVPTLQLLPVHARGDRSHPDNGRRRQVRRLDLTPLHGSSPANRSWRAHHRRTCCRSHEHNRHKSEQLGYNHTQRSLDSAISP